MNDRQNQLIQANPLEEGEAHGGIRDPPRPQPNRVQNRENIQEFLQGSLIKWLIPVFVLIIGILVYGKYFYVSDTQYSNPSLNISQKEDSRHDNKSANKSEPENNVFANLKKFKDTPGKAYNKMTEELIGISEMLPSIDYDQLYRHPTNLFPSSIQSNISNTDLKAQLLELRDSLATKKTFLNKISTEMDEIIIGHLEHIPILMSLINDVEEPLKFVFIGSQSVGKSHVLNAITSLSLSAMNISMGTKSPVHGKMSAVKQGQEKYSIDGVEMKFEDLLPELKRRFERQNGISETEVELVVQAPFVPFPLDFVDLPGYVVTKREDSSRVIHLIQQYAKDSNVIFVMISDASRDPATEADEVLRTLRSEVDDERIIFIINKVNVLIRENHSERDVVKRIRDHVDYFQCTRQNMPYLFTVPKDPSLGGREDRLPAAAQVERWELLVNQGEDIAKDFTATYSSHWRLYFEESYPSNRIGLKAWKEHTAQRLIDRFHDSFEEFVTEEEAQARIAEAYSHLKPPLWAIALNDFANEWTRLIGEVAINHDGIWQTIINKGGKEFNEDNITSSERTMACAKYLDNIYPGKLYSRSTNSELKGRSLLNKIEYKRRILERGNNLLMREIFKQRDWMLSSYVYLSDSDIDTLLPKQRRHSTVSDHEVAPMVISNIAKRIFSPNVVRNQVIRLDCTFRRISRVAMWLMLVERNETDPVLILSGQPLFQKFVNSEFDKFLEEAYSASSKYLKRHIGHVMDGEILDKQLKFKKAELQSTFEDLYENWPDLPNSGIHLPLIGRPSEQEEGSLSLEQFYDLLRNEAIVHYSERIIRLADDVTEHWTVEWVDISEADKFKTLRERLLESLNEANIVEKFDLGRGFLTASALNAEKQHFMRAIGEGVLNMRNRLQTVLDILKVFDPYQPRFHSLRHENQNKTESSRNKTKSAGTNQETISPKSTEGSKSDSKFQTLNSMSFQNSEDSIPQNEKQKVEQSTKPNAPPKKGRARVPSRFT